MNLIKLKTNQNRLNQGLKINFMTQEDNKLARERYYGFNPIEKKERVKKKRNPKMFSREDYPSDDFFFGKETSYKKK